MPALSAAGAERAWTRGFAKADGVRVALARGIARVLAQLCERAGRAEHTVHWREKATGD